MENQTTSIQDGEPKRGNSDDHEYDAYLRRLAARFDANTDAGAEPLFTTDAHKRHDTALWDAYLNSFPPEQRQFHNCSCCRHFIQRFGTLVTIKDGRTTPAVWDVDDAPELYKPAVEALARLVRRAKVTGLFLSENAALGQPVTGIWRHFAVLNGSIFKRTTKTAKQTMAERRQDFGNVARALSEITPAVLLQAVTLLKTEQLWRSEKVIGPAEWLHTIAEERRSLSGQLRDNALWRAIAGVPAGFCHPRSSMIGTLIADIEGGLAFEDVRRKFAAKMDPTIYQRPQAAPTAGNIKVAEKLVETLGLAPSLRRRFARLEDVLEKVWEPAAGIAFAEETDGTKRVFGHLKPKGEVAPASMRMPPVVITWDKFARTVLPTAKAIELMVPVRGSFSALVTAAVPEAPPILQWDLPERRNPVSWYLYSGGSPASSWSVEAGTWAKVTAIALEPPQWFGGHFSHQGEGALFVLDGCKDLRVNSAGLGIFPECLKAELREVKATIEAFSLAGTLEGLDEASACGIKIKKGQVCTAHVRVFGGPGTLAVEYQIDRYD